MYELGITVGKEVVGLADQTRRALSKLIRLESTWIVYQKGDRMSEPESELDPEMSTDLPGDGEESQDALDPDEGEQEIQEGDVLIPIPQDGRAWVVDGELFYPLPEATHGVKREQLPPHLQVVLRDNYIFEG